MTTERKNFYMYHKTPGGVPQEEFGENWDRIFGKKASANQNIIEDTNIAAEPSKVEQQLIDPSEAFRKRVSDRAYFMFEARNRSAEHIVHGYHEEDWLAAEKIERDLEQQTVSIEAPNPAKKTESKKIQPTKNETIWETAGRIGKRVGEPENLLDRMWKDGQFKKWDENGKEIKQEDKTETAGDTTKTNKAETQQKPSEIKIGLATWNGNPVKITEYAGQLGGKDYVHIEGTRAIIPLDEIEYPKKPTQEAENKNNDQKKEDREAQKTEADRPAKEDKESPEMKAMREKEEKRRKLEKECKEKLEAARKKGEQEGREKLLTEIEEKKNKNIFRKFGKFIKRHKKVIIAGVVGAAIVAATWATMQSLSLYLPWNVPITTINNFINGVRFP